ncbi:hypothetical protein CGCSCA4_v014022 [Colletotrichum siamense]|uniref:Uncharacterized protein n=1 Tax=Colletotrichum siamense TaxID=690259 RepID=A0A9P5BMI8_COLSI|nr:hypothetical protein CGCSCA5_v010655 [Colletotrichum siamense]KAF4831328.1 hypothetical protein CGCSCA4_v014022 [Colletotrichum siamense]KAF4843865.1 hypothetical protein CGCSCA2_v014085 [Colletotrichum siamense]KAF4880741.1 hypothetical protein CGCSCA1_v000053 [Colletotrichum siamense]
MHIATGINQKVGREHVHSCSRGRHGRERPADQQRLCETRRVGRGRLRGLEALVRVAVCHFIDPADLSGTLPAASRDGGSVAALPFIHRQKTRVFQSSQSAIAALGPPIGHGLEKSKRKPDATGPVRRRHRSSMPSLRYARCAAVRDGVPFLFSIPEAASGLAFSSPGRPCSLSSCSMARRDVPTVSAGEHDGGIYSWPVIVEGGWAVRALSPLPLTGRSRVRRHRVGIDFYKVGHHPVETCS